MPETQEIVINPGPLIALVAGLGDLSILQMYRRVCVPLEVSQELLVGGGTRFGAREFAEADWLEKRQEALNISLYLLNSLDRGEAAVIQLALNEGISTACIDEVSGRRSARLHGLLVTGSIGILLRAKREGCLHSIGEVIGADGA
jgi:predicted nucleic acid-binding protein